MISRVCIGLLLVFIFDNCSKNEEFPEELVGKWEWQYSLVLQPVYNNLNQFTHNIIIDTIYPMNNQYGIDYEASFEISEKGNVSLYKNDYLLIKINHRQMTLSNSALNIIYSNDGYYKKKTGRFNGFHLNLYSENSAFCIDFPIDGESNSLNINETSITNEGLSNVSINNYFTK